MKKIAIFGLGITGKSVIKYLVNNKQHVVAIDDNPESLEELKEEYSKTPDLVSKIDFCYDKLSLNWSKLECLIVSPGVPLKYPSPHQIVLLAQKNNCKIIGDIELFYLINKNSNFIGITGTNGKSTTTSLTGHIFKSNKVSTKIGGNIGVACFDLKQSKNYIFEMSSYQLDLNRNTRFKIASLLNITPDHLDRHKDMKGYIKVKKRIFLNQNEGDFSLINIDDENCLKIYKELKEDETFNAKIVAISTQKTTKDSISIIDGQIIDNIHDSVIDLPEFDNLKGTHNKQNIAFAYAMAKISNIREEQIINSIKSYKTLSHRLEFIKKIKNISFINDSKATNIESTICALEAYNNVFWIAGGESKNNNFSLLEKYLNKIQKAFLIGRDQEKFANFLNINKIENYLCNDLDKAFDKAVKMATDISNKEINILLSPSCASFDQFRSFEVRGDHFRKLVKDLTI